MKNDPLIIITLVIATALIITSTIRINELEAQAEKFTTCEDYGMTTEATVIDKKRKIIRIACK